MKNLLSNIFLFALILGFAACGNQAEKSGKEMAADTKEKTEVLGNVAKGKSLYTTCAVCHGNQAEGMASLNAPALSGQEPYYLKMQLNNYRTNKRGVHEKDIFGAQMLPMAKLLNSDGIRDVIAYIQTMPEPTLEVTLETGDAAAGENYYNMICGACHGAGAKGIESLSSPRLTGLQDWYIERQLNNFRDSIRGIHSDDKFGAQMQQIAASIPDDQTIKNLVAYLNSLHPE
jgi:cytochrome c oxidase subunit 2